MNDFISIIGKINDSWLVKGILSAVSVLCMHLFGAWDIMLQSIVTLMVLDCIAKILKLSYQCGGYVKAIRANRISSKAMGIKTMYKTLRYALVLAAGNQISKMLHVAMGSATLSVFGIPIDEGIRAFFILWLCIAEVTSILETLVQVDGCDLKPLEENVKGFKNKWLSNLLQRIADEIIERVSDNVKIGNCSEDKKEDNKEE